MKTTDSDQSDNRKNAPYRSSRREARRTGKLQAKGERRLVVYSELREQPDIRKIAKAVIAIAAQKAAREAQAQEEHGSAQTREPADE